MPSIESELWALIVEISKDPVWDHGIVWAIRYLQEKQTINTWLKIWSEWLKNDLKQVSTWEFQLLYIFENSLEQGFFVEDLSRENKLKPEFQSSLPIIAHLFSLRNAHNPEALKKIWLLINPDGSVNLWDSSDSIIFIEFGHRRDSYYIKSIRIEDHMKHDGVIEENNSGGVNTGNTSIT